MHKSSFIGYGTLLSLLFAVASESLRLETLPEVDLAKGKRLYEAACQRCHGNSGDETDYYGIVPLAGFPRRPPQGFVAEFRKSEFYVRGEHFEGLAARSLTAYLSSLRGNKGFPDPGWLYSKYLLHRKLDFLESCRIIDMRSEDDYLAGHIPNAVRWAEPSKESLEPWPLETVADRLGEIGVSPNTQIVIYDEREGAKSTQLWWSILRSGHHYVAVLDGGWANWVDSGYEVRTDAPLIPPTEFRSNPVHTKVCVSDGPQKTLKLGLADSVYSPVTVDVRRMQGEMGLFPAEKILSYLQQCGLETQVVYTVEGSSQEIAFLIFVLHLLGHSSLIFDLDSALLSFHGVAFDL